MTLEKFIPQLDGCTYVSGGNNCNAASTAMLLFRATQGRVDLTSCQVRRLMGDTSGGTNLEQSARVLDHFGVTGYRLWRPGSAADLRTLQLSNAYGAIWQIGYSAIAGTDYDCFDGQFRGGHSVYVKGASLAYASEGDPGADGRRPTVPEGWQSIPWSLLVRAAGVLPLGNGMTLNQEFGSGKVYALIGPKDPTPVTTRWLVRINAPDPPRLSLLDRPFGTRKASVTRATYICSLGPKVKSPSNGLLYSWYRVVSKADGSRTANAGLYFTPNRYVDAERI